VLRRRMRGPLDDSEEEEEIDLDQKEEEVISNRPSRGVFFMSEVKVAERQSARELVCERGREE